MKIPILLKQCSYALRIILFIVAIAASIWVVAQDSIAERQARKKLEIDELYKKFQLEHKCSKTDSVELLKSQINTLTKKLFNCENR